MRFHRKHAPLLLLLLPSVALSASVGGDELATNDRISTRAEAGRDESLAVDSTIASSNSKGTKVAPVDGKDGMPHEGPFVSLSDKKSRRKGGDVDTAGAALEDPAPLKKSPSDSTLADGKKIPESNDGVMDDPHRKPPKRGTTGTEGGVSEKAKARKAKEGKTGEKAEMIPETPKEKPPLPHSEHIKMLGDRDAQAEVDTTKSEKSTDDVSGLEKPADLPGKIYDRPNPMPDSANKDHLDISKPSKSRTEPHAPESSEDGEGIIRPFHSFMLSLTMIIFAEIGDKTFLVAALMAMKHDRMVVFTAAFSALLVMTVLSAILGHTVPAFMPKRLTSFLAAGLFFIFGGKLLREGMLMDPNEGVGAEMQEVEMELEEKEHQASKKDRSSVSPYALEMGLARDRKPRQPARFPAAHRSPSTSPARSPSPRGSVVSDVTVGLSNLLSLLLSPAWVQTFAMTFLGEWGDRSQIATIAMASGQDYWWMSLGALIGHSLCTAVAVIGGRAIAGKVSLKVVTMGGAVTFIVFGFVYLYEAFYS